VPGSAVVSVRGVCACSAALGGVEDMSNVLLRFSERLCAGPVGPKHQAPCLYTLKLQLSMTLHAQVPGHRAIGLTSRRTNQSKYQLLALQAQVADIGLMGCPTKKDGKAVEGVRIFLGGSIGENAQLASEFEKASLSLLPRMTLEGTHQYCLLRP
jgi:hypothetical protein